MKKRLAAVFLALTLSLLAVAGAVGAEKSIVIALGSDALFMDPSQQDETITNTMGRYMYDGLLNNNALGLPEPALATSWTIGDDCPVPHLIDSIKRRYTEDQRGGGEKWVNTLQVILSWKR